MVGEDRLGDLAGLVHVVGGHYVEVQERVGGVDEIKRL